MIRDLLLAAGNRRPVVTWNPSDKSSVITLSNGNRDAALANDSAGSLVRATRGESSGKWYWEVEVLGHTSFPPMTGVANASAAVTVYPGFNTNGWSYWGYDGQKYTNATPAAYGSTSGNVVIGIELDMDAGTLAFRISNVSQGTAFTGLSGTLYPAVGNPGGGTQDVRGKFKPADLTYSPPSGFLAIGG